MYVELNIRPITPFSVIHFMYTLLNFRTLVIMIMILMMILIIIIIIMTTKIIIKSKSKDI